MPINLHLTPTAPCKHPSIAGAFSRFGSGVCAASFYPRRFFFSCYTAEESGNLSPNRGRNKNSDTILKAGLNSLPHECTQWRILLNIARGTYSFPSLLQYEAIT